MISEAGYLLTVIFIFLTWLVVVTAVIWLRMKIPALIG